MYIIRHSLNWPALPAQNALKKELAKVQDISTILNRAGIKAEHLALDLSEVPKEERPAEIKDKFTIVTQKAIGDFEDLIQGKIENHETISLGERIKLSREFWLG